MAPPKEALKLRQIPITPKKYIMTAAREKQKIYQRMPRPLSKIADKRMVVTRNPIMYPPVGPRRVAHPELNPEKNGIPAHPSSAYRSIDAAPSLYPSTAPDRSTVNVCSVMGTGVNPRGILTAPAHPVHNAKKATATH